jgi:hypothetical protein
MSGDLSLGLITRSRSKMMRALRESITLKPAEESFRQGWQEALRGETRPVSDLWEDIDAG